MNGIYHNILYRICQSFTAIFHQWMNIAANTFPIMPALCLMLSVTHYAQNYAGMIGGSLYVTAPCAVQASEDLDCTKSSYI